MLVVIAVGAMPLAQLQTSSFDPHDYSTAIRARRPADEPIFVRGNVRRESPARSTHIGPALLSTAGGSTLPGLSGSVVREDDAARHAVATSSVTLRGPPSSL
jgi:hypothetical protein